MILHQRPLTRLPLDQAGCLWWGIQGSVKRNKKTKDKDKKINIVSRLIRLLLEAIMLYVMSRINGHQKPGPAKDNHGIGRILLVCKDCTNKEGLKIYQ
jgi:hypothetical protein